MLGMALAATEQGGGSGGGGGGTSAAGSGLEEQVQRGKTRYGVFRM